MKKINFMLLALALGIALSLQTGGLQVLADGPGGMEDEAGEAGGPGGMEDEAGEAGSVVKEIYTAEELGEIAHAPNASYRLMADIDMTDVSWIPPAFCGTFDGNGYAILNVQILTTGSGVEETYDGNRKVYDTSFAGFFDTLKGAVVKDLKLVNLRIDVDTQLPCFLGGIAGYMENSIIQDCSIQGELRLRACDRMFGVGGIIGYGCGSIRSTQADVTLICTDTDASTRDEQFMGGVCAAGYPDINGCSIRIAGYDSEHGYVHNGGLVGMYMFYPGETKYYGSITDNSVTGRITFFEDNTNRRAYCSGFIGEIMNWDFENGRNQADFERDERFTYDVELLPHSCEKKKETEGIVWEETVTEPGCDSFGFTTRCCKTCGYTETDRYTLKSHTLKWREIKAPTPEETGIERGSCVNCSFEETRELPVLEPEPSPEPTPVPAVPAVPEPEEAVDTDGAGEPQKLPIAVLALVITGLAWGCFGLAVVTQRKRRSGK